MFCAFFCVFLCVSAPKSAGEDVEGVGGGCQHSKVFPGGFFAGEDVEGVGGEGEHFVFAGVGVAGGKETDLFGDLVHKGFAVGNAAGKKDGVDVAVQNGSHGANFFGYGVGHCIKNSRCRECRGGGTCRGGSGRSGAGGGGGRCGGGVAGGSGRCGGLGLGIGLGLGLDAGAEFQEGVGAGEGDHAALAGDFFADFLKSVVA